MGNYVSTVTELLTSPGRFFENRFEMVSVRQSFGILILSGLFFSTIGTIINTNSVSVRTGIVLFANAIGMATIGAVIAYVALIAVTGRRYAFSKLWSIFSLSAGAVLILAWVPAAFFLTEPWRWWLIGTGLVRGLGLSKIRAVIVVLLTFGTLVILVYTIFSMAGH